MQKSRGQSKKIWFLRTLYTVHGKWRFFQKSRTILRLIDFAGCLCYDKNERLSSWTKWKISIISGQMCAVWDFSAVASEWQTARRGVHCAPACRGGFPCPPVDFDAISRNDTTYEIQYAPARVQHFLCDYTNRRNIWRKKLLFSACWCFCWEYSLSLHMPIIPILI